MLPGSDVLAVGYPYPLGDAFPDVLLTRVVSAIGRLMVTLYSNRYGTIGELGRALVNFAGEVVGINVAKYVDVDIEGIGLAIPIDDKGLSFNMQGSNCA